MAKIINPSNQNVQGRLGDLVYYQLNGKSYVRSAPTRFRDPSTEKQNIHRKKFTALVKLACIFKPAMRFKLTRNNTNQTNTFSKLNWKNISYSSDSVLIDYQNIVLSNQINISLLHLNITKTPNHFHFQWEEDHLLNDSFLVLCVVYCKSLRSVYTNIVPRNSLSANIYIPDNAGETFSYTVTYLK